MKTSKAPDQRHYRPIDRPLQTGVFLTTILRKSSIGPFAILTTLALVVFDLHRFKEVNDRYGHPQGDILLQMAAATLRKSHAYFRLRIPDWWRRIRAFAPAIRHWNKPLP